MKFLAALLLVVASVHSNSLHHYGWAPGKEMVFNYQSQVLTGIPEISQSHWSGIKMNAKVIVQSFADYSLRLKISEPEFLTINGQNIKLSETGRVLREQESSDSFKVESLTEEFRRFLLEPFMAHMKAGVVESLMVSKNEPASVTNIKKSILSQIQMDVAGTRRSELETNHIQMPVSEEGIEQISYFTTMEESVQGECMTEYTIHRLPQFKINELEEAWRIEELKVKDFNIESESEAKAICEGKPYYLITRTKNLDQCKKTPFFQMYSRDTLANSDLTSANELGMIVSTTNTFVCGELNEFVIRKVAHKRVAEATITGYNTDERATSPSQVNMSLLKIKNITSRLNVPSSINVIKSLVFGYPGQISGEEQLNQEVVEKTEELLGMRPQLPQPGLTSAPHNIVMDLNLQQIIPQIFETIQKMAREVYQSPESCSSKSDLAGKLSTLSMYMRNLNLAQLEQLERQVLNGSQTTGMKSMEKIFYDILSLVGTNPSTMLIIKKVKEGSLPSALLTKIVSYAIRNVRYPTHEIMEELVQMLQFSTVKSNKQLYTSSMLQLSNLFYHAYVNPTTMKNNFPTKVFGVFGTKESQVLTEKFIPFLVEEIEETEHEHVRVSAILALGKTGHLKALKTLVKEIEQASLQTEENSATKVSMIEARRSIAVNALKRIAKMNPIETRPILMSVIVNPVESAEVRIAAVAVLPFSQPTTAEIQKLAIRSWLEPSKQVSSFVVSTLRSLAYTQVPELKIVAIKARSVLPLIKNEQYGIQYSHNVNYSSFVEYLRVLINNEYQLVNSKESLIPHKMSLKTVYYSPSNSYKVPAIDFSAYTYGMDFLLEKYLHFFSTEEQTTSSIREQLNRISEELKLKTREHSTPFGFLFNSWNGIDSSLYLDSELVLESLEELTSKFESGHQAEFNHIGSHMLFDSSYMFVTETGFPILATSVMPIVYSIRGSFMVSPMEGKMLPKINGKLIPVLNGKMETRFGVISPFTKELIGSGVDMSIHSSLPLELEGKMSQGQIDLSVRIPAEAQRSGNEIVPFHGFVLPYTFKHNLKQITPISQSSQKKIDSGLKRQPIKMEIGQSLGLSARFAYESEAKVVDIFSYIQKITQHTPLSILPSAIFPSSVRRTFVALVFNPSQSETKEFNIVVGLSTKGMMHSLSKRVITEQQISGEFSHVHNVLSQLEKANIVEITGMTKSSSGSELKKIQSIIVLGKSSGISSTMSHLAAVEASINGQSYALKYEGKIINPRMMNRWNIERMIDESLNGGFQGELFFGKSNQLESFKFVAELEKTEQLRKEIRESPEYKKCMAEQQRGEMLTPTCTMVRREAASVDKIHLTVHTPKSWSKTYFMTLLDSVSKALLLSQVESEQVYNGTEGLLKVEARAERTSELATYAKVWTPTRQVVLRNVRLMGYTKSVFPSTFLSTPMEVAALKMSGYHMPSTCRVEPSFIRTFDNMTVDYKINDCEHVLLLDGSRHIPVSVITKTVESEKKIVKILSGINEVKMVPVSGSMKVIVNGEELRLPAAGERLVKKNQEGQTLVIVQRFQDGVVSVHVPEQGLKVLSNGSRIEVVAPQMLKSRTVGLCGDMNGERSADLKTPRMCVMRPRLAAFSFMLNKSGSSSGFERCSGLPSAIKEEFMRESNKCSRETIVPTPVSELHERISMLLKPTGMTHIVDKQSTQLCISKQMVKTCLSKPLSIKQKSVEFVCVPQPSVMALSLEQRALSGETLFQEISKLPTVFRKVEFEPVACETEMASVSVI